MPLVRPRPGGRGASRLTPPDARLRRALAAAMEVARAGETSMPPLPAPTGLLPFLRFARLPPAALAATRRVLEADAEFRARVAAATDESEVGREGWLFLTRPDGWDTELEQSAPTEQAFMGSQPTQAPPPQSTSVSVPFFTASAQPLAWQTRAVQTPF